MERVWCWRCKSWICALDEAEYRNLEVLFRETTLHVKDARSKGEALDAARARYAPLIAAFEELTGESGVTPEEIMKHRISNFGPPCAACDKNLRTARASKCFECGKDREGFFLSRTDTTKTDE